MPLITIELADSPRDLRVPDGAAGAGILVLRNGWPVQFLLHPSPGGSVIPAAQVATLLAEQPLAEDRPLARSFAEEPGVSITIAICTKDRPEWAARCLDSVLQVCGKAPEVDILLVDNAPGDDRTREAVAARPGVRYVREPLPGLNFARNRAVREARGELLAFLDDDAVLGPTWLAGVRVAWRENPDAGGAVGPILPYELVTRAQYRFEWRGGFGRRFTPERHVHAGPQAPLHPNEVFGAGCNMIFRRSVLEALGGFDIALDTGRPLPGGGDLDMIYRVQTTGLPFLNEPLCVVFHEHRRTHAQLRRQMWTWGLAFTAYLNKIYTDAPEARPLLRDHYQTYLYRQFRTLASRLPFRECSRNFPPDLVLAEIAGAMLALTGTYGRSVQRTCRIQNEGTTL